MCIFYMSKNPETRVPPDQQLVQWLRQLPDDFHAFLDVVGSDFKSRCLLVKPRGVFHVFPDSSVYTVAQKTGPWRLQGAKETENPVGPLNDQSNKIRDFIIQERNHIWGEHANSGGFEKLLSKAVVILWLVALTNKGMLQGEKAQLSRRIFCDAKGFCNFVQGFCWNRKLTLDEPAIRRFADLLGLEAVDLRRAEIKPKAAPLINPYYYVGAVDPRRFKGRTKELRRAKGCLIPDPPTPVALVGLQRTGKSSLGEEIARQLVAENQTAQVSTYVFGEWDKKGEHADVSGYLLYSVASSPYVTELSEIISKLSLKRSVGLERQIFKESLRKLHRLTKRYIVLFLDELHKLNEHSAGPGHDSFADFLENIAKDKTLGLRLIISARPSIFTHHENINKTNLLKLFDHIRVGSVDDDAALQIISLGQPPLVYTDEAVSRILSLSGRNPYWIQLLCHKVFQYIELNGKRFSVTKSMVNTVFEEILYGTGAKPYFSALYEDVRELGLPGTLLYKASELANQENTLVSCDDLQSICGLDRESLNGGLQPLFDYEILVRHTETDPPSVSFKSEGLRCWLRLESILPVNKSP